MAALLVVLAAVLLGCLAVLRFGGFGTVEPRWASALLVFGTGTALGIGGMSCLFFVCRLVLPGLPILPLVLEIVLAAWLAFEVYRGRGRTAPAGTDGPAFPWNFALAGALLVALGLSAAAINAAWETNPQGNWDAWSVWNLRARFLASGADTFARAWSSLLASSHPEYPLLVSGFVARAWAYSHTFSVAAPMATSYLFYLALVALSAGGLAALRSGSLGLLFGLTLAGTATLLHEVPAQYADVPLACYMAGAVILLLLDRPVLAGAMAGCAAWTKDEGLLFIVALAAAAAWLHRDRILRLAAGAVPVMAIALFFRFVLAGHAQSQVATSASGMGPRITDVGRYGTVLGAFLTEIWQMRSGWYHPLLPVVVLAAVLRFKPEWRRDMLLAGAVTAVMFAGYFAVYVTTFNDLNWLLQTSATRVLVQVWPVLLLSVFCGLRTPESLATVPAAAPAAPVRQKSRKKAKA